MKGCFSINYSESSLNTSNVETKTNQTLRNMVKAFIGLKWVEAWRQKMNVFNFTLYHAYKTKQVA
jgi:hypothetical protein